MPRRFSSCIYTITFEEAYMVCIDIDGAGVSVNVCANTAIGANATSANANNLVVNGYISLISYPTLPFKFPRMSTVV